MAVVSLHVAKELVVLLLAPGKLEGASVEAGAGLDAGAVTVEVVAGGDLPAELNAVAAWRDGLQGEGLVYREQILFADGPGGQGAQ
ncbi:hypothetical protein D9M71_796980 [compost metagenome]